MNDSLTSGEASNTEELDDMIPAERQQRLLEWLTANIGGSNHQFARMFNTSISTIRRDLDALASQGLVQRTHGGAVVTRRRTTYEPSAIVASMMAVDEKKAIAIEAVSRVEPGQSIFIDTGSTMVEFARKLSETNIPLTVITCDIQVAALLALRPNIRLVMPGGTCREGAYALLGEPGFSFLKDLQYDQLFLSAQALDAECVSDTYLDLVTLKRAMLKAARTKTLLIDSSRISSRAIYSVVHTANLDEIITDDGLPQAQSELYNTLGVKFTRVIIPQFRDEN